MIDMKRIVIVVQRDMETHSMGRWSQPTMSTRISLGFAESFIQRIAEVSICGVCRIMVDRKLTVASCQIAR
jgi:hypothetical protein